MTDSYRLLITGSRSLMTWRPVYQVLWGWHHYVMTLSSGQPMKLVVVHGAAPQGVDLFAAQFVEYMKSGMVPIEQEPYPADWDGPCDPSSGMCQVGHRRPSRFGSSPDFCPTAGHRRNQVMVDTRPHSYIAITDRPLEKSRGSWDCVQRAEKAGLMGERIECHVPVAGMVQMRFDQAGNYIR